jgi:hypothetical protein
MKELLASGHGMDGDMQAAANTATERKAIAYRQRAPRWAMPLFLMSLMSVGGCHAPWLFETYDPIVDDTRFMNIWETYRHCSSSSEPDEIRTDLQELNSVARVVRAQSQPSVHLPAAIRSWMEALPSRLAVDPSAMAAACAVHGARVAQTAGRSDLSMELFAAAGAVEEGRSYVRYAAGTNRMLKFK